MAIPHPYGRLQFGADLELHFRTLIGAGCNPNAAAVVVIGIEDGWTQKVVDGIKANGKPVVGFGIEKDRQEVHRGLRHRQGRDAHPPRPVVHGFQICANPRTVRTMSEHIDVDTTGLLQRELTLDQAGDKLLDNMLRTANGRLTAAEALGHREFVMTRLYESA